MDYRALRPPTEANDNTPAEAAPGTVGPPSARPGDPNGVELIEGPPGVPPTAFPAPAAWSGWPAEWATAWTSVATLTDTAWACLDLNASVLASMPPYLVGASDSLPADWVTNPDPDRYTSWADFAKSLCWDYQLGEVFLIATARYANGYPARFHVVEPWLVNVEFDSHGFRQYSIGGAPVPAGDICHIRYRTQTSNARGEGPLDAGANRLIAADVLSRYATNLAASGGIPPSVLEHPDELSSEQAAALQAQWIAARMSSVGLPAVLSGGVKWSPTGVSPTDMALVELQATNAAGIAVLLGVPPFLVGLPSGGDSLTYSNVSSLFDYHWRAGLRPKADAVCSGLSGWLLPRGTSVEVNRDEYVRPDPKTRAETWQILIAAGIITNDEARTFERFGLGTPAPVLPAAPTPAPDPVEAPNG